LGDERLRRGKRKRRLASKLRAAFASNDRIDGMIADSLELATKLRPIAG
jgi:hypothetical protein